MFVVTRSHHNPLITPNPDHAWEGFATFNPSPIKKGKVTHVLYRAMSHIDVLAEQRQRSVIGIAESTDGKHFKNHAPFIVPEEEWEKYGCEDPRITHFEGLYYTFYTALSRYPFDGDGIKVGVAVSKGLKKVGERHLVTPFNAKAMALFPERINGKATVIFSAHTEKLPTKIVVKQVKEVEDLWKEKTWDGFEDRLDEYALDLKRLEHDHVEVGSAPIKTKYGWLLIYSHIQNYFSHPDGGERIFGIEAVLLDLKDPTKIVGRTKGPILAPAESYEVHGYVENIVFPSGALLEKDILHIYYGGADTVCCRAKVNLEDLISSMHPQTYHAWHLKRYEGNPILTPSSEKGREWEAQAVLNPAALRIGDTTHLLYRAISADNTSTIGYATTKDGVRINKRYLNPIYIPRTELEMKKVPGGNSGCEDPRLTKVGNKIYMCYTAYDGIDVPRVAVTSIFEKDFLEGRFNWSLPELITPQGVDDKDACIFPEKIGKKYLILHRIGTDICGDYLDSLDFIDEKVNKCIRVLGPRPGMWDSVKTGIAAPPVKTKYGWLLLYHAISREHHSYRVGAVLLDLKDPTLVVARSTDPIFEPIEDYEKTGVVSNVVFPCGMTEQKGVLYVYYGGADKVVGVATMKLDVLLKALTRDK